MNRLTLFAIFSVALFSGCGDQSAALSSNKASNAGPVEYSFDRASANAANTMANAASVADVTAQTAAQTGRTRAVLANQPTSLNQAERSQDLPTIDRKVIRNAELNLETTTPDDAQRSIGSIAERKGGFVVESTQNITDKTSQKRDTVLISLRVPADKFADALDEIRLSASRVVSENIKGEDVTEEFIDIEARLKAKKALEQQFMEIMKRANSVDDALSVQSELADVRSEIERVEGRKRFLENQSSMSTIKIKLQTPEAISRTSDGFGDKLSGSFGRGLDFALNFVLGFVTFAIGALPFALIILLPGFLAGRAIMRRRSRPMSFSEIAKDEIKTE